MPIWHIIFFSGQFQQVRLLCHFGIVQNGTIGEELYDCADISR